MNAFRTLVCQISRGVAPARSIAAAAQWATLARHAQYRLIEGRPAVEAKNLAAQGARTASLDLVLIEDDVMVPGSAWREAFESIEDDVLLCTATCRNGEPNTKYTNDGAVLYSGTVFVRVPVSVLQRLPAPVFRAYQFSPSAQELMPMGPSPTGHGSDVWFWYQVRQLEPRPSIRVIGHATHLLHPLNRDQHDLEHPCEITELP